MNHLAENQIARRSVHPGRACSLRFLALFTVLLLCATVSYGNPAPGTDAEIDTSIRYVIKPKSRPERAIDVAASGTTVGTNVLFWGFNRTPNQYFRFIPAGNNYYYVDTLLMDWRSLGLGPDQRNVCIADRRQGKALKVRIVNAGDGFVRFEHVLQNGGTSHLAVSEDGSNLISSPGLAGDSIQFKLYTEERSAFLRVAGTGNHAQIFEGEATNRYFAELREGMGYRFVIRPAGDKLYSIHWEPDGPNGRRIFHLGVSNERFKGDPNDLYLEFTPGSNPGKGGVFAIVGREDGAVDLRLPNFGNGQYFLTPKVSAGATNNVQSSMIVVRASAADRPGFLLDKVDERRYEEAQRAYQESRTSRENGSMSPGGTVKLFDSTYTFPRGERPVYLTLKRLVCYETQDDGEDELELKISATQPGGAVASETLRRTMNEVDDKLSTWEINKTFRLDGPVKIELWEDDSGTPNVYNVQDELLGRELRISRDKPIGLYYHWMRGYRQWNFDQKKSKWSDAGADGSYQLQYWLSDDPGGAIPKMQFPYFSKNFIGNSILKGATFGGPFLVEAFAKQKVALDGTALAIGEDINEERRAEFWAEFGETLGEGAFDAFETGVDDGARMIITSIARGAASASDDFAISAIRVGLAGGLKALGATAVASSLVAVPLMLANVEGMATVQIVNATDMPLNISEIEMISGLQSYGLNRLDAIPPMRRVDSGGKVVEMGTSAIFVFDKSYGLEGIEAKIQMTMLKGNSPLRCQVHVDVPYSGDNTIGVDLSSWRKEAGGVATRSYVSFEGVCVQASVSDNSGWTPGYIVVVFRADDPVLSAAHFRLSEIPRQTQAEDARELNEKLQKKLKD